MTWDVFSLKRNAWRRLTVLERREFYLCAALNIWWQNNQLPPPQLFYVARTLSHLRNCCCVSNRLVTFVEWSNMLMQCSCGRVKEWVTIIDFLQSLHTHPKKYNYLHHWGLQDCPVVNYLTFHTSCINQCAKTFEEVKCLKHHTNKRSRCLFSRGRLLTLHTS